MTNDLRIAELPAGTMGGMIGITFAPGKKQASGLTGLHERDLAADLDAVAAWGAAAVVTLMQADELDRYRIPAIGEEVRARFMEWHHLPIRDVDVPDAAFEAGWPGHSARLRALVAAGNRVLVHCRGGLGRAGMVAARLLVEMGADPEAAIAAVRRARDPHAVETRAQEAWVRRGRPRDLPRPDVAGARDRAVGAMLGLAVGDAVGTTIEFSAKPARAVLSDMVGGGPFGLQAGQWTDDTAMALALADSLLAAPDLDPRHLMRRFVAWYRDGIFSCTGRCFDIGATTAAALRRFERTRNAFAGSTDPDTAGNGSIMRLAPVAVRHWRDRETLLRVARDQSRTTHAAPEAVEGCEILADLLASAIHGTTLPALVASAAAGRVRGFRPGQARREVRGTGYVVASLHAAVWAVSRTSTFRDAVLLAANLGEDADTTAAVAGQIAGALYGASAIPDEWLDRLAGRGRIELMAGCLFEAGAGRLAA
ncbi:ADP-ribosylglycohydrolase family protein [Methylobacterium sp. C33D]